MEKLVGATEALSKKVLSVSYDILPDDVRQVAKQCLLDWVAVSISGEREPLVNILNNLTRSDGGSNEASIIGQVRLVNVRQAALVNGSMSHALDYDDVNALMSGHPSVVTWPTALALGEARHISGKDALAAFVAGYELAVWLAALVEPGHYDRGFHNTATIGTFASAATAGHIFNFNQKSMQNALGVAGTQAAGLKSVFGTMCKPFHAGIANYRGILAAQLTSEGFTSIQDIIECYQGFAYSQTDTTNPSMIEKVDSDKWHILDNLFKYHASCYQTHAMLNALKKLQDDNKIKPDLIDQIIVIQDDCANTVCNIQNPATGLEIKFSLKQLAAHLLIGLDTGDIKTFTEKNANRSDLAALRDKVDVQFRSNWPITKSDVTIHMKDGSRYHVVEDSGIPETNLNRQWEKLISKFHSIGNERIDTKKIDKIVQQVNDFDSLSDIADFMTILREI